MANTSDELFSRIERLEFNQRSRRNRAFVYLGFQLLVGVILATWTIWQSYQLDRQGDELRAGQIEIQRLDAQIGEQKREIETYKTQLDHTRRQGELMRRGLILLQSRQYEEAVKLLDQAIELDPQNPNAHNLKGYAELRRGRVLAAIESLNRSLEVDPEYVWGHYNLALAYWAHRDFSMALGEVRRVVELDPDFRRVLQKDVQFNKFRSSREFLSIVGQ